MQKKLIITYFSILLFFFSIGSVLADVGPKPSADIYVTLSGEKIPDSAFSAKLLTCQNEVTDEVQPSLIPQFDLNEYDSTGDCFWRVTDSYTHGGECKNNRCNFQYYIPKEFRLAVYLPSQDKVYLSQVVENINYTSWYSANLLPDGTIDLFETTNFLLSDYFKPIRSFMVALLITVILELLVALTYVLVRKKPKKILTSVIAASVITLPLVWFVFPHIKGLNGLLLLFIAEIFVVIFEARFIYALNKDTISTKSSFKLSLAMNVVSLVFGIVIYEIASLFLLLN